MWKSNPSAISATPISSRKASASILVVGCSAMKAPTGLAARYMTIIAMTTAAMISAKVERLGVPLGACSPWPSISRWISCVDFAIRKAPPPIRIMSRQEMPIPNRLNSGAVRPISQVRPKSIITRNRKASDSPIWRARRASLGSQREVRSEMKTRLSMPSTISSTVSVASASQAFGSNSSAIISFQPIRQADGDHINRHRDQRPGHPWAGFEIAENGNGRQPRPGQHRRDVEAAQPDDTERMHELERHEGQHRQRSHHCGGKPRLRLEQKQIESHSVP